MRVGQSDAAVQALPDLDGDVFRGGNDVVERRDLVIEEAVIHGIDHFGVDDFLQLAEVEDHAGDGVGIALDGHFQHVIMAVAVRIGVGAVKRTILVLAQRRIAADVRGGEFGFAGEEHGSLYRCLGGRSAMQRLARSYKMIA